MLARAEEELPRDFRFDPILPAVYLFTLWAHAIASIRTGSGAADHFHSYLTKALDEYDEYEHDIGLAWGTAEDDQADVDQNAPGSRKMHPQIRRLICAAIAWSGHAATRSVVEPSYHQTRRHEDFTSRCDTCTSKAGSRAR